MKYSKQIKPISYLKAHASEMVKDANENGSTYIITQNGEAKVIVQDIKEYERQKEKMAMLKLISLAEKEVAEGKVTPLKETFIELDKKIASLKKEWNIK